MKKHLLRFGLFTSVPLLAFGFYKLFTNMYYNDPIGFYVLVGSVGFGSLITFTYYVIEK